MEIHEDFVERQGGGDHDAARSSDSVCSTVPRLSSMSCIMSPMFSFGTMMKAFHDRLADLLDDAHVRQVGRVVHLDVLAVGFDDFVDDAWVGGDDVHVVLPPEAFLDDFHVEEAEEAAAKAKAESDGAFRLKDERGVVELELGHRRFEVLEIRGIDRVDAAEDHRMDLLEAGQRFRAGCRASVKVSPILISAVLLILAMKYPTSPASRRGCGSIFGVKTPTSLIS